MMDSILEMATPEMRQALAARLDESVEGVHSGLTAATAATLSGLHRRMAAADVAFLGRILRLLEGGAGRSVAGSLPVIASNGPTDPAPAINRFLTMSFGTQQAAVATAVAQHAGVKPSSGLELLKTAAALVLAYVSRVHSGGIHEVSSLRSMLQAEAHNLPSYLPASLLPGAPTATHHTTLAIPAWAARTCAIAGALLLVWLLVRLKASVARGTSRARTSDRR